MPKMSDWVRVMEEYCADIGVDPANLSAETVNDLMLEAALRKRNNVTELALRRAEDKLEQIRQEFRK